MTAYILRQCSAQGVLACSSICCRPKDASLIQCLGTVCIPTFLSTVTALAVNDCLYPAPVQCARSTGLFFNMLQAQGCLGVDRPLGKVKVHRQTLPNPSSGGPVSYAYIYGVPDDFPRSRVPASLCDILEAPVERIEGIIVAICVPSLVLFTPRGRHGT
jgi:hypothetical protein